jgi:hypothetical protein
MNLEVSVPLCGIDIEVQVNQKEAGKIKKLGKLTIPSGLKEPSYL